MKTTHRMTFTIPTQMVEAIDAMSRIWKISKSKIITICLECSFPLLDEELEDIGGKQPPKKLPNTTPMTVTVPIEVKKRLQYYSKELDWKQSHIVIASLYYHLLMDKTEKEELDKQIDELMS